MGQVWKSSSDSFGGLRLDGDDQAKEAHDRSPARQLARHEGQDDSDDVEGVMVAMAGTDPARPLIFQRFMGSVPKFSRSSTRSICRRARTRLRPFASTARVFAPATM